MIFEWRSVHLLQNNSSGLIFCYYSKIRVRLFRLELANLFESGDNSSQPILATGYHSALEINRFTQFYYFSITDYVMFSVLSYFRDHHRRYRTKIWLRECGQRIFEIRTSQNSVQPVVDET